MPKIGRKVKIFSALEVANICGVVNQTAINWIKNGYLKAFTTPGGQYRIYAKDLATFLDNRGMGDSGEALQILLEKANWGILLIATADMVLNNHLQEELTKTIPDFSILQACDSFEMGLKVAGEKPGFILLDRDLPGMNYNQVIKSLKKDPLYGKPYVFIMTNGSEMGESLKINDYAEKKDSEEPEDSADKMLSNPPNVKDIIEIIKELENKLRL